MEKKNFFKFAQATCLVAFVAMALACSSNKDAVDAIDGFTEGWREGRGYSFQLETTDSTSTIPTQELATQERSEYAAENTDLASR